MTDLTPQYLEEQRQQREKTQNQQVSKSSQTSSTSATAGEEKKEIQRSEGLEPTQRPDADARLSIKENERRYRLDTNRLQQCARPFISDIEDLLFWACNKYFGYTQGMSEVRVYSERHC